MAKKRNAKVPPDSASERPSEPQDGVDMLTPAIKTASATDAPRSLPPEVWLLR